MKYFKTGDHVKITAGKKNGVTGMVLRVDQQIVYANANRLKAGVPMDNPMAKYFVKGYDGEVSAEAIRLAAEEANLIQKAAEAAQVKAEADAWNRVTRAQRAGGTSEPVADWASKINQARSEQEVMQILAQARQEAENL